MAARWAVIELARHLGLLMLEMVELNVTGRGENPPEGGNIYTFSYHVDPVSFWVYVATEAGRYVPISAMVRKGDQSRYFSFVYDMKLEFNHIEELPEQNGRFWMIIVSPSLGDK